MNVTFELPSAAVDKFTTLLQSGIAVQTTAGTPLLDILLDLPGFTLEYIEDEVQTIFLDGTALDDVYAPLADAQVVALSAAMPGLSGAIFRRNSIHGNLRSVQHEKTDIESRGLITITLKLFNAIARDRGPTLLERGITMKADRVSAFLRQREWLKLDAIRIDGEKIDQDQFLDRISPLDSLHVRLQSPAS